MITRETLTVLAEVALERDRQIEKGWTPQHDDGHTIHDLVRLAEQRARLEGSGGYGVYSRERLVQAAAMLVAAVETWDRRSS